MILVHIAHRLFHLTNQENLGRSLNQNLHFPLLHVKQNYRRPQTSSAAMALPQYLPVMTRIIYRRKKKQSAESSNVGTPTIVAAIEPEASGTG
jgi:hypothetical protein